MKIVILQGAFFPIPPLLGGAVEKKWFRLGEAFASMGHEVTHISRKYNGLPEYEIIKGVRHKRVDGFPAPKSIFFYKLLDAIYTWRAIKIISLEADVVVTNTFWAPVFLFFNKRSVVYVDVARMPKGQMKLYRRADRLRGNTCAVVDAIKSELKEFDYKKIGLIPNPLPFESLEYFNFDLNLKKKIILYCGRVHKEKGLELLAMALKFINLSEWKVKIVGPWDVSLGGSGVDYKKYLIECFDGIDVEFTGGVFEELELIDIYRKSSIFVYPSLAEKGETFGLAPLEAMAFGSVPVVSDLSCFKDFIRHKHNGLIFDHREKNAHINLAYSIEWLSRNSDLRNALAVEAFKVRLTHSIKNIANQFVDDFKELIDIRRGQIEEL